VKGQVIDSKGVAAWGYGARPAGAVIGSAGEPSDNAADQVNAWKNTPCHRARAAGDRAHDPLAYLQNAPSTGSIISFAARDCCSSMWRTPPVVEQSIRKARLQDRERLKPILRIDRVRAPQSTKPRLMFALQHEVLAAQGIAIQGVGRQGIARDLTRYDVARGFSRVARSPEGIALRNVKKRFDARQIGMADCRSRWRLRPSGCQTADGGRNVLRYVNSANRALNQPGYVNYAGPDADPEITRSCSCVGCIDFDR